MENLLLAVGIEYRALLQTTRVVMIERLCLDRLVWTRMKYLLGLKVECFMFSHLWYHVKQKGTQKESGGL